MAGGEQDGRGAIWAALALAAAFVFVARCVAVIFAFDQTTDEPYHAGSAVAYWEAGGHVTGVEHPPLTRVVVGAAMRAAGVELPEYRGTTTVRANDDAFAAGTRAFFEQRADYRTILRAGRVAGLVFPLAALLYVWLLGRWLGGPVVAAAAAAFCSVDPTLLGHSTWITTDGAGAAGFLACVYHGGRWIERPTWGRAAAAGLAVGLGVAAKFSVLFALPSLAVLAAVRPLAVRRTHNDESEASAASASRWSAPRRTAGQVGIAAGVAFIALWACYGFAVGPMGDQTVLGDDPRWLALPAWVRDTPVPMPALPLGLARLLGHSAAGHFSYLNGEWRSHGWWSYFPEAVALKTPLAALAAWALAAVIAARAVVRSRAPVAAWATAVLLVPTAVFVAAAMAGSINIGVRHLLPVLPLAYLFACWWLVKVGRRRTLMVLIAVAAVETAVVHPDYLAYFNVAAGGTNAGDRYFVDSNLDWGQDLRRLGDFLRDDPSAAGRAVSVRLDSFRQSPLLGANGIDPASLRRPLDRGGLLAINTRFAHLPANAWLLDRRPVARVGASILVYDLDRDGPPPPGAPPIAWGESPAEPPSAWADPGEE